MKKEGSGFEYKEQRDRALLRAYYELRGNKYPSEHDFFEAVVNAPSERFWVSEERATAVVASMIRGKKLDNMLQNKASMFEEIHRRVLELRKSRPNEPLSYLVFDVVNQPAPKFYITPKSAKVIICKIKKEKKKCYEEKKRKLKFMLM